MRAALVLALLLAAPHLAVEAAPSPAQRALAYLAAAQAADGTFPVPNAATVVEAAAAAGLDPATWPSPERSAMDALARRPRGDDGAYRHDLRIAHGLAAAGYDPARWNGGDLVAAARAGFRDGQFGDPALLNDDAFAILALRAASVPASDPQLQAAADVLAASRAADGGWSFSRASPASSADMTGFVLAALTAAGRDVRSDERAGIFLESVREPLDGGYKGLASETRANCQSTVWALHARHVLGLAPDPEAERFLLALQRSDGGLARTRDDASSNAFCTSEAVVHLAGARYPLRGFLPLPAPTLHALEPTTLPMPTGATHARWSIEGVGIVEGASPAATFPAAGSYAYRLDAGGPGGRHRGEGELLVRSARPVVALPPEMDALRLVPVAFGLDAGADADGAVQAVQVDWGDGNVTEPAPQAERAFALPRDVVVRVRAMDDEGGWSGWAQTLVRVRNRAPTLDGLPARVTTDRLAMVELAPRVADPEGDEVALVNATARLFPTLGEHAWHVEARDPYGGVAAARVLVEVRNVPPRLENVTVSPQATAGEDVRLDARALDADGAEPRIAWRVGDLTLDGASVTARLEAGVHQVTVEAVDADGGIARAERVLTVVAPGDHAAPPRVPWIDALEVELTEDALVVRVDAAPDASLRVSWTSDVGDGEAALSGAGRHAFPLVGATHARVRLVATLEGLEVAREAEATREASPAAPLPPPVFDAAPARVRVGVPLRLVLVPLADVETYAFDFGDGNATPPSPETVATHAYGRGGAFEVVVLARAADGRASRASLVVTVDPLPAVLPATPAPEPLIRHAGGAEVLDEPAPEEDVTREAMEPRREAPLPWAWPVLLLAALGRRARRG